MKTLFTYRFVLAMLIAVAVMSSGCATKEPNLQSDLSADFQQAPMEARPSGYWWKFKEI
ncbi:MAG: hypothetical protein R6U56_06295 [Opitutales bacterium]